MAPPPSDPLMAGLSRDHLSAPQERAAPDPWAQRFFELSADLLLVMDAEGRILKASPSWGQVLGCPPASLETERYTRFVHPEDLPGVEHQLRALTGSEARSAFTCRWLCPDGSTPRLSWTVSASASDGTRYGAARPLEALATEEALVRSELSFRKLIERAPEAICVHRDQRFVYVNPAMLAGLRYEHARDLIGKPIFDVIHPDDHAMTRAREATLLATSQAAAPQELRFLRSDGSTYAIESVALAVEFDGAPSVLVMARDITERKRMQAQLAQADRMVVMGTLAAGVGHEINNPLTYVLSNLALAGEDLEQLRQELEEQVPALAEAQEWSSRLRDLREMLQEAHAGADRVRLIVRDLKIFSRQGEERRAAVDVREVLDFSIKMAFNEMRSRGRLVKQYDTVPAVYADGARLGQVFLNLLVNAAQAIPEGHVGINEICVRVRRDVPGRVAVEVSDTGTGISPEVLPRIFDPFFTTRPVGAGTGLGLSICHGIIQSLGGDIRVHSELGRGTTFTVLLPADASVPAPQEAARVPGEGRRAHVLVVDDEPAVGRALARTLGLQHTVTVMESGQEALERLLAGASFDAIFCDLIMPDLSGMDLYERVRQQKPGLTGRFVFMTGGAFTPRAREFLKTVPNAWLEKPFDAQQLMRLLTQVLREHGASREGTHPER